MPLYEKAFFVAALFLAGVGAASVGLGPLALAACGLFLFGIAAFLPKLLFGSARRALAFVLLLPLLAGGYFYFLSTDSLREPDIPAGSEADFEALIAADPKVGPQSQSFEVELLLPHHGRLTVITGRFPSLRYGDIVRLSGEVAYDESRKTHVALFPEIGIVSRNNGNAARRFLFDIKDIFVGNIGRAFDAEDAALLAGITVGDRGGFSAEYRDAMAESGTTHITALSGQNITIVASVVAGFLGAAIGKRKAFYGSVAAVVLFAAMTGAEPSVVRAAVMGILVLVAGRLGRAYHIRNAAVFAAVAMVLFDPRVLAFDIGFQLSFAALFGIVAVKPALEALFHIGKKDFFGIRDTLFTSVGAQLAVAPLLLYHFGSLNLLSVAANVLILEFVPFLMGVGFLAGALGTFLPDFGHLLSFFAHPLLLFVHAVIRFFARASLPVGISSFSIALGLVYYALLFSFVGAFSKKETKS